MSILQGHISTQGGPKAASAGVNAQAPKASGAPVSRRLSAVESLKRSNRRLLIMGPPGSGKTTLSVSASQFAGDTIPAKERVVCSDLVVLQGDMEGIAGAYGAGFEPGGVYDFASCETWDSYIKELLAALKEIKAEESIRYVVVDLALPDRLIRKKLTPENQKEWGLVAKEGDALFEAFSALRGVTVIGNAQIKASSSPGETVQAMNASEAKSVGGERSTFAMDLCKGIGKIWMDNSSLTISRVVKRTKEGPEYSSLTQSTLKHEAKSRFRHTLLPTEPGARSLHSLLVQAYGEAL